MLDQKKNKLLVNTSLCKFNTVKCHLESHEDAHILERAFHLEHHLEQE